MLKPLLFNKKNDDFFTALKKRVHEYFDTNNIDTGANFEMYVKAVFCLSLWIGSYLFLILGNYSIEVSYFVWAIHGIAMPLVSVNIGHDAIHGAWSKKKWICDLLSLTFTLNGASPYLWKRSHNVAHHTFTNIDEYDDDIKPLPLIRISPKTKLMKIHRFQYIYSFFFYLFATLSWVFSKDYIQFFKKEYSIFLRKNHPKIEYFKLFFEKLLYYFLVLVLPLLLIELPWYHILGGFILMHFIGGTYLALIFMLAHCVEEAHFPEPKLDGTIENTWSIHQMYTCVNFAPKSKLASFLSGGLNQQVEHHLFPNICSIHYPQLSDIVRDTAKEFNIPYFSHPTFWHSISSHIRFLKKIGNVENYLPSTIYFKVA